jgi:SAM-dependent MidA family methyltransferase
MAAMSSNPASGGGDAGSTGTPVEAIAEAIRAQGPIPFSRFMELALYGPGGYYHGAPVGPAGDFVTSPHLSPVFGILVARQVEEHWALLGRPATWRVIEAGAGHGTLATQLLEALAPDIRRATEFVAVERGRDGRRALVSRGLTTFDRLEDVPPMPVGCLLANELLDNLPFDLIRGTPNGQVELRVDVDGGGFAWAEGGPASPPDGATIGPGETAVVPRALFEFLDVAASRFGRGYLWFVDYGPQAMPHTYREHRVGEDLLSDPGHRDITAGVDFAGLVHHARSVGLQVWGPRSQREVLLALGFREWSERTRLEQVAALGERRGVDAVRAWSARSGASALIDLAGVGGSAVVCLGIGDVPPPSWAG